MNRKHLALASFLILCLVGAVVAQTRLRRGVASVSIDDSSNILLATQTAGSVRVTGGGLKVGGGATLSKLLSGTASLNFGATAAGACDALTITVTGAASGDTVALGVPHALANADAYQAFDAWVSAANTVTVRRCNLTNATTALSDPAAATVRATVLQF